MSRARHKKGGVVVSNPPVTDAYAGGDSTVVKYAKQRKHGGRATVDGAKPKMHLGRPGRKSGGRIGANKAPLSTAARITATAES
jgi:hypothetical protein